MIAVVGLTELSLAAEPVSTFLERATNRRVAGDLAGAERDLNAGLAAWPDNPELLYRLGLIVAFQGRYHEALGILARARRGAPDDLDIAIATARVLYWSDNLAGAERVLAEILSRSPGNPEAEQLRATFDAKKHDVMLADRPWRLDLSGSQSRFSRQNRSDWWEGSAEISRQVADLVRIHGSVLTSKRFGNLDSLYRLGVSGRISPQADAYAFAGVTPGADFHPRWIVDVGGSALVLADAGSIGDLSIVASGREAAYASGDVQTLKLGVRHNFGENIALTPQAINSWDENGAYHLGWSLRADADLTGYASIFIGAADASETADNRSLTTRSYFAGGQYDVSDDLSLRAAYEYEDRSGSYIRKVLTLGISVRY